MFLAGIEISGMKWFRVSQFLNFEILPKYKERFIIWLKTRLHHETRFLEEPAS